MAIDFKNSYEQNAYNVLMDSFGPIISTALQNEHVNEIMLNSDGSIYVEDQLAGMNKVGSLSYNEAETILRTLASLINREINQHSPIISGEIPYNGSRFEGLLPPLVPFPVFSIRRHNSLALPLQQLSEIGLLNAESYHILHQAVQQRRSLIISGSTGSGKTTLLNALIYDIPHQERLIVIEDTPEIRINARNHTNMYTNEFVDMSVLLRSALRLRPDRIIVGEVRGAEALDLVDALSTGHRGSMATLHAGSITQALQRLTLLISRHPAAPRMIEPTLASALDLIVQLDPQPQRQVSTIAQITGFSDGHFCLNEIYHAPNRPHIAPQAATIGTASSPDPSAIKYEWAS